jgi:hypothetical protein
MDYESGMFWMEGFREVASAMIIGMAECLWRKQT